jgi:hypothetical protein
MHVVLRAQVRWDDRVEILWVESGSLGRGALVSPRQRAFQRADDLARDLERVLVAEGEVIRDTRYTRMHVRTTQLLGGHVDAGRRLHQRWPANEDRALTLDDDRLVAHRRDVRAARGA